MSLTRIKDAFAIFKNIVLDARANSKGGSESKGPQVPSDLAKQVEDLRSCLLQRDTEIAILVNMVKKGKTAGDVGGAVDESYDGPVTGDRRGGYNRDPSGEQSSLDRPPDESFSRGSSRGAGRGDDSAGAKSFGDRSTARDEKAARAEAKAAAAADEDRGATIIKRHLFGVPPPDDRRIFDDMSGD